ncbi:recombinase family protein [Polynucleobacter sp. 30F-ANTBAC]|nr:recombinase family protein [Polynucleobacter sp. 30F-ANTBAC]
MAQANDGTSLTTQLQLGQKKAKQLKFEARHWDEGGKSSHHEEITGRPVLLKLYEAIKRGEVKHLWVYDQSRLSRNDQVASIFRYECNKQGVTLYTKDGQFDLSSPSDKLLKQMLDAVAEFENSVRAERTRLGKLSKATSGFWHGGPPPFGYKLEDKKLVIDKDESKWIKRIYEESLKGSTTLDVKKLLDSKGVSPRRRNGLWSLGSIQSLIKNTHYIGYYSYHDKKVNTKIKISCPAIIEENVWKAVNYSKTRVINRTQQKNPTKNFYLLRDLMFCGHCGRPISARSKPSKKENLYYCPNKERDWVVNGGSKEPWKRGVGCGMARSMNIPETDLVVMDLVTSIHKNSSTLKEEVKKRILKEQGVTHIKSESEIKSLQSKIKRLESQLNQAKEAQGALEFNFLSGELDKKVYEFGIKQAKSRIIEIDTILTNLKLEQQSNTESKKWVDWVKAFGEEVDQKTKLTDEDKKAYLSGLVEKIEARYIKDTNEHELTIIFNLPIVKDSIKWKDEKKKSKGYTVVKGKTEARVMVKKKDPRWKKMPPQHSHSVTVE